MASSKTPLSEEELHTLLTERPEWSLRDGKLVRQWTFKDFSAAMDFVNSVAVLASWPSTTPTSTSATTASNSRWSRTMPAASPRETPAWPDS